MLLSIKQLKSGVLAYRLVTSHLRLVVKVVTKYKGYGLPVNEMISEGNILRPFIILLINLNLKKGLGFLLMLYGGLKLLSKNIF